MKSSPTNTSDAELNLSHPLRIGVIGGGASGMALCAQLMRKATKPILISCFEAKSAGGVAYITRDRQHLLNVPAGRMSIISDEPDHFLRWLSREGIKASPLSFQPRAEYGRYLEATIQEEAARTESMMDLKPLRRINAEVVKIEVGAEGEIKLLTSDHYSHLVDRLVLAAGNIGADENRFFSGLNSGPKKALVANPWRDLDLDYLASKNSIAIVGTGLTAVDTILSIMSSSFRGKVVALSRHGHLCSNHFLESFSRQYPFSVSPESWKKTALGYWKAFRCEINQARSAGYDWRSVLDALRPFTSQLWRQLTALEQRRFLRHGKHYWDIHRHRMAPEISLEIEELLKTGRLELKAGRLNSVRATNDEVEISWTERSSENSSTLEFGAVVDCTGPNWNVPTLQSRLVRWLLAQGWAKQHPSGLGFAIDTEDRLEGTVSSPFSIYTLGPIRIGLLWETTAIPEIRIQAEKMAGKLLT